MTEKDFELIIVEGFLQTPETRVDFFLSKAKENNCQPVTFCTSLVKTYRRLFDYVNSVSHNTWSVDESGKKYPVLNTITLNSLTDGLYTGHLNNENITEVLPSLLKMANLLTPNDEAGKPVKTGFQSSLKNEQIQPLFELLKGKYIDINTNPDHFKAVFKTDPLPSDYLPIKRTKQFSGTLLAYLVYKLFYDKNQSDYWHIAANCFDKAKNLKQSLRNTYEYNPNRKPKGYKDIDIILNSIYPPLQ